jgi:hypothetical protein
MEVAGVPAKDEGSEGGIAGREIGVAGFEVERPEGPRAERPGELRNTNANIDIHGDHAWNHRDGIGAAENLPRRHISERGDGRGVVLLHADLSEAVEDGPLGVAVIVVGVRAEIEARNRGENAAEDVGVAFHPGTGAELGGACRMGLSDRGTASDDRPGGKQSQRRLGATEPSPPLANRFAHLRVPHSVFDPTGSRRVNSHVVGRRRWSRRVAVCAT